MKNREIISELVNQLKALNYDDRISKRFLLSKLRDKASFYIKRENELLKLFNYTDIWTTVSCIEMNPANMVDCCCVNIPKCSKFMKSKYPLPDIYAYKGGPLIKSLLSIDGFYEYKLTTPLQYKDILNREFQNQNIKYYWIENNYIVIPDSEVRMVSITAYFKDRIEANKLNSCDDDPSKACMSPLDDEFLCPSHILDMVKKDTIGELYQTYVRKVEDELEDDNTNTKR